MAKAELAANEQARETFRASQEPRVSVGRPDGKLADFRTRNGQTEIVVYFANVGPNPALNFHTNIWSTEPSPQTVPETHIGRFVDLDPRHYPFAVKPGEAGILLANAGPDLPGNALRAVTIRKESVPTGKSLAEIRRGKFFLVVGTFEYCDLFGNLSCQAFSVKYDAALNDFVGFSGNSGCWVGPERPDEVMLPPDNKWLIPLPRCEQPQERGSQTSP